MIKRKASMDIKNKNNINSGVLSVQQRVPHPIANMSFEDVFGNSDSYLSKMDKYAKSKIVNSLSLPVRAEDIVNVQNKSSKLSIVFSDEVYKGLKDGKYQQIVSKEYGLLYADARDKSGKIVEHGKIGLKKTPSLSKIFSGVTTAAHIISDMDTQRQLEEMNKKLDIMYSFLVDDRVGEVKGAFDLLASYMRRSVVEPHDQMAEKLRSDLTTLEARFYETAHNKLLSVNKPSKGNFFKETFYSDSTCIKNIEREIESAMADLRYMKISNHLIWVLEGEFDNFNEQIAIKKRLLEKLGKITNEMKDKCRYSVELFKKVDDGELFDREIRCLKKSIKASELLNSGSETIDIVPLRIT